ncbi:oligosaccharide flippase family protein [Nesterenkonia aurantiaca]|uniref:O-antigen/teichoic acid export membrane protein n=1 Tax=Nesterenkonia aurantiaca TaxID=1436010 RepID=A0A4R7FV51_9MICC|nr:oligosaccharide flippase family protein [Nesterenkonia aurantiaca]TDS82633.1 O-antigen/teichoic acid export membrane protein [Nesterenkonia aurantiaca]
MRRLFRSIIDDSPSLLAIGRLVAAALALISAPIVARAIGPDGRGETAAAIALFHIVPVVIALGVPLAVRRRAATADGQVAIGAARLLSAVSVVPACIAAAICSITLFASFDTDMRTIATVGVAAAPLIVSWSSDISLLVAHSRYRAVMSMQLIQPFIYLVLVIILWQAQRADTATVLIAYLSGLAATFFTGLFLVKGRFEGAIREIPVLVKDGVRFAGSALAETASNRLDQALLLPIAGATQAGYYAVATTIVTIPLAIGQAIGASYFTPIARAANLNDRLSLQWSAARSGLAISIFCYFWLCLLAPFVVPLLFGEAFRPAVPVIWAAAIGGFAMTSGYVASMALAAEGRGARMTIAQVTALAVSLTLLWLLAPTLGAVGAAIASSVGYVVLLMLLLSGFRGSLSVLAPRPRDLHEGIKRLLRRGAH